MVLTAPIIYLRFRSETKVHWLADWLIMPMTEARMSEPRLQSSRPYLTQFAQRRQLSRLASRRAVQSKSLECSSDSTREASQYESGAGMVRMRMSLTYKDACLLGLEAAHSSREAARWDHPCVASRVTEKRFNDVYNR